VIVEALVTTMDAAGRVNLAPMGVEWDESCIVLKPFVDTTTFRNLRATPAAVVHLTDDVGLFVEAALAEPAFGWAPAARVRGAVLDGACSWRELEVTAVDATPPRARVATRTVARGTGREFLGFNRARHAVLEGTILATRTHLLPHAEIAAELARLAVPVRKTAGPAETAAWSRLLALVRARGVALPEALT
jgi:hypothetical protein